MKKNKYLIYTTDFNNYDYILDPLYKEKNFDYIIFTNKKKKNYKIWKTKFIDLKKFSTDKSANLYLRFSYSNIFTNYDATVYIDGNLVPFTTFKDEFNLFLNSPNKIGISTHPYYDNYLDDFNACLQLNKIKNHSNLINEINFYKKINFKNYDGYFETNVIFKKKDVNFFQKIQFQIINFYGQYLNRDQGVISYILWKNKVAVFKFNSFIKLKPFKFIINKHYQGRLYNYCYIKLKYFLYKINFSRRILLKLKK